MGAWFLQNFLHWEIANTKGLFLWINISQTGMFEQCRIKFLRIQGISCFKSSFQNCSEGNKYVASCIGDKNFYFKLCVVGGVLMGGGGGMEGAIPPKQKF